jgi:D-alanyl-lipoteichoic acid acyltransferase DltB (MBOAT superfamily)
MLEITTAIFLTLVGSAFYHLVPESMQRVRLVYVAALSFIVVFAHYPIAALLAVSMGLLAWVLAVLGRNFPAWKKYGPFSLIAVLAFFSFENIEVATNPYSTTLVQFGLSFYTLRLYLAVRTAAARGTKVGLEEFLAIALFFPIFAAGPICAQEAFSGSSHQKRPLLQNYLLGMLRIGIGIFALYFLAGVITDLTIPLMQLSGYKILWQDMGAINTYLYMVLRFANLYANLVGYTEIAIGLGLFFGFEIPENFKYPFLATNIQNFWQRWHLSLSRFIATQIYMPLMISLRKPRFSMFLAFSLVGMWHQVSFQYAVWGMGHGAMLAAYMWLSGSAQYLRIKSLVPARVWLVASWLLTITLVSFLSTFANQADIEGAMRFTSGLVPGW